MTQQYGTPNTFVTMWEDFLRDVPSTFLQETAANSGSQDLSTTSHGGWWTQTVSTGETDDVLAATEISWEVDEGFPLILETRIRSSDVSASGIFFGLTDARTEGIAVLPYEEEDGTGAVLAADLVGFLLEESVNWDAVGIQNTAANTSVSLSAAADSVDTGIQILRLELNPNSSGTAQYFVGSANEMGGGVLASTQTAWFRSGIEYCLMLGVNGRGAALTVDYDYIFVQAPRS